VPVLRGGGFAGSAHNTRKWAVDANRTALCVLPRSFIRRCFCGRAQAIRRIHFLPANAPGTGGTHCFLTARRGTRQGGAPTRAKHESGGVPLQARRRSSNALPSQTQELIYFHTRCPFSWVVRSSPLSAATREPAHKIRKSDPPCFRQPANIACPTGIICRWATLAA